MIKIMSYTSKRLPWLEMQADSNRQSLIYQSQTQSKKIFYFTTLREESSKTNVILQYKLLASILSAVCSVIQQS